MADVTLTVLGARGFVGQEIMRQLEDRGIAFSAPAKGDERIFREPLGRVIYCCGLTADFRQRPHDTIEAHVCLLNRILRDADLEKLVYLSSTRVFQRSPTGHEDEILSLDPNSPGDLYNASKLMGEFLCESSARPTVVARLSNVYGTDWESENFLNSLIKDGVSRGEVEIQSASESAKDYVSLRDVARWLIELALGDSQGRYNLAGGQNITNGEIAQGLRDTLGCSVTFAGNAPQWTFPGISIERITEQHGPPAHDLLADLPGLIEDYRRHSQQHNQNSTRK